MKNKRYTAALAAFAKAAAELNAAWSNASPESPAYPFAKSFDEVSAEISDWANTVSRRNDAVDDAGPGSDLGLAAAVEAARAV